MQRIIIASLFSTAIIGIFLISYWIAGDVVERNSSREAPNSLPASYEGVSEEVMLIYIGASTCSFCQHPKLKVLLDNIIEGLGQRAKNEGRHYVTLGVAKDLSVKKGLKYITNVSDFDEVSAGRGWLNTSVLKFVWNDLPGQAATPQILIIGRTIYGGKGEPFSVTNEQLLLRRVGLEEISKWHESGFPLPVRQEAHHVESTVEPNMNVAADES